MDFDGFPNAFLRESSINFEYFWKVFKSIVEGTFNGIANVFEGMLKVFSIYTCISKVTAFKCIWKVAFLPTYVKGILDAFKVS